MANGPHGQQAAGPSRCWAVCEGRWAVTEPLGRRGPWASFRKTLKEEVN